MRSWKPRCGVRGATSRRDWSLTRERWHSRPADTASPQAAAALDCGMDYAKRIQALRADIDRARCQRRQAVRLLAVAKTRSVAEVAAAYHAGQTEFGENYLQEALAKVSALACLDIRWHFVGAIQSNKTRDIARCFHWVHTLDRRRIATRLAAAAQRDINVCIQVNVDNEPQKAGVAPQALPALLDHVRREPRLRLRGLMVIPKPDGDVRGSFRRTRQLFETLAPQAGEHWDTLSMGMSADYVAAIEEGATIVRIGTAIFGPRPAKAERP